MQLPELLQQKLDILGITKAELHRRSGLSSTLISKYFNGQRNPIKSNLDILCRELHITEIELKNLK